MTDDSFVAKQATPATTLEQHIMDPNIPKTEVEWWARRRISALLAESHGLRQRLDGYKGSRDWAIETLSSALHIEPYQPQRALEYYARLAAENLVRLRMECDQYGARWRNTEDELERHTLIASTAARFQIARTDRLAAALRMFYPGPCPVCSGDCVAANSPVTACPMKMARAALAEVEKGK